MVAFRSWLRMGAAVLLAAGLLGTGTGCRRGSASASGTIGINGSVAFLPQYVAYDGSGNPVPAAALPSQGARGVLVRAFQLFDKTTPDGTLVPTWNLAGTGVTDSDGAFAISGTIYPGYSTFLEVTSIFEQGGGHGSSVKVVADPGGIGSALKEPDRPIYVYRVDLAGNPLPDPTANPGAVTVATAGVTLPITLTTSEAWAVTAPDWFKPGNVVSLTPGGPTAQKPTDSLALGSKVLGILDSLYVFSYYFGDPTPSKVAGGVLDLHYWPGSASHPAVAFDPRRRSYVVYDPSLTPKADDGIRMHYFGTLAGGPPLGGGTVVDDAWDRGVLFPMLARNNLVGQNMTTLTPTGTSALPSLAPDLALVDGLGDAMAACLLKSPFLTDTTTATGQVARDIRTIPVPAGVGSPAALASLGWQVLLRANSVFVTPGGPAEWATIDPANAATLRLFTLTRPTGPIITGSSTVVRTDIASILTQLGRLQEIDPLGVFADTPLYFMTLPYGIPWTHVTGWTPFATNWGLDPDSLVAALPSFTLSMAGARTVPDPDPADTATLVYPNCSQGEVAYATLSLRNDRSYKLWVETDQVLPAGAAIEVVVDGAEQPPILLSASAAAVAYPVLTGNPFDNTLPTWHYLRIRLVDPAAVAPDVKVTVHLEKVS